MVRFRTIQYKSIHFFISTFCQILCLIYFLLQPVCVLSATSRTFQDNSGPVTGGGQLSYSELRGKKMKICNRNVASLSLSLSLSLNQLNIYIT